MVVATEFSREEVRHQIQQELENNGHALILKECRRFDRTVEELVPIVIDIASKKANDGDVPADALRRAVYLAVKALA